MMALGAFWEGGLVTRLIILGLAGFGFSGGVVVAWSLPAAYLKDKTAPAGIAMVSTLATMSGLFAPWLIGIMRESTGTNAAASAQYCGCHGGSCFNYDLPDSSQSRICQRQIKPRNFLN